MGVCLFEPKVSKKDMEQTPVGGTKMDKDILARTMEQLRSGVVHKQVVSGREFKGRPFNSKPEVIHFKVSHDEGKKPSIYSPASDTFRSDLGKPCEGACLGAGMQGLRCQPKERAPGRTFKGA